MMHKANEIIIRAILTSMWRGLNNVQIQYTQEYIFKFAWFI